jgi:hypothetical protein
MPEHEPQRAGVLFELGDLFIGVFVIGGGDHRVDEVHGFFEVVHGDLARFHRAARHEDRGDVQPHGGHQHPRRDLVAVRDADHRVGAVCVDHVFHAVRDDLARGQRVEHAVMAHGDAVVDRDGVEFLGDTARLLDLARDELAEILEVDVARHELGETVHHRDDRLAEVLVGHACGTPEAAGTGHVAAVGGAAGTVKCHVSLLRAGRGRVYAQDRPVAMTKASARPGTGRTHPVHTLYIRSAPSHENPHPRSNFRRSAELVGSICSI